MSTSTVRSRFSLSGLTAKDLVSSLFAGVIISILVVFVEVSLAAMVFSGELESALSQGIGVFLFGALVIGLWLTFTSSFVSVIAVPQDSPAAIIAVIAAAIVASLLDNDPEHILGTVIAVMMLSSMITGVVFWLMGHFNLGRLVRFIPYPVVGGFLGGTGWLLMLGGLGVMTDTALGLALFQPAILLQWLPGLLFAVILFALLRRYSHFLLMPSILLGGILLFYIIFFISNGSLSSPDLDEWLLGPFPEGGLFQLMTLRVFTEGHIYVVTDSLFDFSSILIISTISLLLNASGLEVISGEDIDLNQELKATGIANLLAGLGGSAPGYHSISLSALGNKLGAKNRLVGLIASIILAFTLFFGAEALSVFPRIIAGGLLVFLGISFLFEWVYDAWFKMPKLDYFLIWLILIIIATVGFLEGVAAGIVVAVLLFVLNYSQVNVIRYDVTAANFPSYVLRPRLHDQLLRQRGDSLYILELQGFIFFGTADKLVSQIRVRIEDPQLSQLRFLLLDFRLVTGIDSSAALSFSKLSQLAKAREITVVFTELSPGYQEIFDDALKKDLIVFSDMDQGLAWCEDRMIEVFAEVGLVAKPKTIIQLIEEELAHVAEEKDWLDTITPGEKSEPSKRASRLLKYLEYIEANEGDYLINENYDIEGLYFIEEGQVKVLKTCQDGSSIILRLLESGTAFGEIDY